MLSSRPYSPILQSAYASVHLDTLLLELHFRLINLFHELLVRIWHIVEGEDAVAEFEKEEGAGGDERPERKLYTIRIYGNHCAECVAYVGYDFFLDLGGQGDEAHEAETIDLGVC